MSPLLPAMEDYYWNMAARGRLIMVERQGLPALLCTFFVLRGEWELPRFHPRPMWTMPPDAPTGSVIYIDKLGGIQFNRQCIRQIVSWMNQRLPMWETAIWHRPGHGPDRRYTLRRRDYHGTGLPGAISR